ncbi:MAG: endonuclease III [Spartobacteria bacterium]|nr:endonuclease III [Spartobacteria bacterium]
MNPTPELKKRAARILRGLKKRYPDARCELNFETSLQLAVAAILSAQCTDKRVNQVTPTLFRKYHSARDYAQVSQGELEKDIHSTGFFRNKANHIRALGKVLDEKFQGQLPEVFDTLVTLPGIGRKTANVLMIAAFNQPGITVDTHCKRLAGRLGLTQHSDPTRIEMDLRAIYPPRDWIQLSHCMVFHGRYCCHARKPDCPDCPVASLCPSRTSVKTPLPRRS